MGMPSVEDLMRAYNLSKGEVDKIFGQNIGPDNGKFGVLGNILTKLLSNPQGFDAKTRQGVLTRLAEREAGTALDQKRRLARLGTVAGGQNAGLMTALQEQLRGESSSRLSSAELDFEVEDQKMKQQQLLQALISGVGLAGVGAGQQGQQAQIAAGMQIPVGSGGAGAGAGLPTQFGLPANRLPGETMAEQIKREAAARAAANPGALGAGQRGGF
ncbi:MAG: hypothetical protein IPL86_16990 [Flavobacteriales bacterium]|nr:hypothetical protein [Flavobacteriales bacterium]